MIRFIRTVGTAAVALSLTAIAVAQTQPRPSLDVRLGLWEVTSTTNFDGVPTIDTSAMSPQQKAQIAQITNAMSGKQTVIKSCMTEEQFVMEPPKLPGTTCEQTLQTNTATLLENTMVCTGASPSTSVSRIEAQSPTAFTGSVTSTSAANGREMGVTIEMTGKWLSADCGDVK